VSCFWACFAGWRRFNWRPPRVSPALDFYTNRASIVILTATITAGLAALLGLFSHRGGFFFAAFFNVVSAFALSAGLAMYQILYSEANSAIDTATANGVDVGITLDYGNGLVRVSSLLPVECLDFESDMLRNSTGPSLVRERPSLPLNRPLRRRLLHRPYL
jgi:hypothetical protein